MFFFFPCTTNAFTLAILPDRDIFLNHIRLKRSLLTFKGVEGEHCLVYINDIGEWGFSPRNENIKIWAEVSSKLQLSHSQLKFISIPTAKWVLRHALQSFGNLRVWYQPDHSWSALLYVLKWESFWENYSSQSVIQTRHWAATADRLPVTMVARSAAAWEAVELLEDRELQDSLSNLGLDIIIPHSPFLKTSRYNCPPPAPCNVSISVSFASLPIATAR